MTAPRTAAGRALKADLDDNGYLESVFTSVEAVETEARAAALDEARAAVEALRNDTGSWDGDTYDAMGRMLAAIDALREPQP